ncbi:hypothetical protein [Paenibacillus azoreducens]|uniref:Uncharacterized protein n=1 Tax=Paenibacillus azoreducens TaxID=116718 RepID=A0A919YGM0_9BACL|nr:hypothetical protein [Paenibacillus azoreducens]GIO48022.1 hypothetical protein J34TS1_27870 [Paenibacillus azoreducens]
MSREDLAKEAIQVGKNAKHNLQLIQEHPEKMIDSKKLSDGMEYLNKMIRIAETETEMKKDRRPGQSRLRTRLKSLLSSIVADERRKRKEGTA